MHTGLSRILLDTNISTSSETFNFLFERNDLTRIIVLTGRSNYVNLMFIGPCIIVRVEE